LIPTSNISSSGSSQQRRGLQKFATATATTGASEIWTCGNPDAWKRTGTASEGGGDGSLFREKCCYRENEDSTDLKIDGWKTTFFVCWGFNPHMAIFFVVNISIIVFI